MMRKSFLYCKTGCDKAPINTLSDLKSNIFSHGRINIILNLLILALTINYFRLSNKCKLEEKLKKSINNSERFRLF